VAPDVHWPDILLPGVVLAFWAFSGFENLTFLSREFRRPERDYLPVSAIALAFTAHAVHRRTRPAA
jgi:amino acid efflux transporter